MNSPLSRSLAVSLTLLLGLVCMAPSRGATTNLANKPIAAGADVPGNLALDLSVEFPTAISIANLGAYSDTTQYVGYFDSAKCYIYIYNSTTPASSYFSPSNIAAGAPGHDCSGTPGQWSGNFMNWAATQTIDPFRWALTGGYRSVDTTSQTILEKAYGSAQGSAGANYPYRGTSQGGGNNLPTSGNLITKLTPFNTWSSFDMGVWGNGKTMVFSGGGSGSGYTLATTSGSVVDLTGDLSVSNTSAGASGAYRLYVRVAVCDPTLVPTLGPAMLESNCVQYGSNYKPEGLLQQYANKIRFSAFGYLNQGGDVRQGGALREPMGYIGPNVPQAPVFSTFAVNPKAEWDPNTGIMGSNPDTASATGSGVTQSGVMNYLNKFGEYGQTYKTYDNVSELYYAAVRYFENLGNVPEWTNGASPTALDGFPAVTTWTDPILYTCQKNFILGIGDDHTWYDYNVGGSTNATGGRAMPAAVAADVFNAATPSVMYNQASLWTTDLQTIEGITPTPWWPFDSGATYFIAGLAYGVHVNDIRPDLADTQTISTYWMDVAEGQRLENLNPYYLAAKYGGFSTPTINAANATLPLYTPANPQYDMLNTPITTAQFDSTGTNVNMNGNLHPLPDNYYNAGNANAMVAGLKSAFTSIASSITQQSTSFSFSLPNVSSGGTMSFGASFDANGWTGTVTGYTLSFDPVTGNPTQTKVWDTTTTLQTQLTTGASSASRRHLQRRQRHTVRGGDGRPRRS